MKILLKFLINALSTIDGIRGSLQTELDKKKAIVL